jgi:hypothetical protein
MKMSKLRTFGLAMLLGLAGTIANAGVLSDIDIPSESNWYLHVNLELMRASSLGQQFMMETYTEAMDDIEKELGVNLRDKIDGVTVFGGELPGKGDVIVDGAVVLHGILDESTRSGLLSALEEQGAKINEVYENGQSYYSIQQEDASTDTGFEENLEDLLFAFGSTQMLVTKSPYLIQSFLSGGGLLSGLSQVRSDALVVLQADRALLQGGANTSADIGEDWDSSVLKNVDSVALLVAEEQGGLMINAQLLATSAEVAMNVRNIVEGMVALKALSDTETVVGDVLRGVRFENEGPVLKMSVAVAADQIEALRNL